MSRAGREFSRPRSFIKTRAKSSTSSADSKGGATATELPAPSPNPQNWFYKVGTDMFAGAPFSCTPPKGLPPRAPIATIDSSDDESINEEDYRLKNLSGSSLTSPTLNSGFVNKAKAPQSPAATSDGSGVRIVAPNVGKLSRNSTIEIKLNSTSEIVTVCCAIDVLKMRSGFFHDILREREETAALANPNAKAVLSVRDPIAIPDASPYEAAAYLESLHEGRSLFKGEWNMSWARLSVMWEVEEHQMEYASQIEAHMLRLLGFIKKSHWRTNPNVLAGCKIALFRKSAGAMPVVISGVAIECVTSMMNSRVRVLFNSRDTLGAMQSPLGVKFDRRDRTPQTPKLNDLGGTSSLAAPEAVEVVGDAEPPFWVQREGASWQDPDDMFLEESRAYISLTDKRIFWEMTRIVIDFCELTRFISSPDIVRTSKELAAVLKRPENRVLWTLDAAEYIPKDAAAELINYAYVSSG